MKRITLLSARSTCLAVAGLFCLSGSFAEVANAQEKEKVVPKVLNFKMKSITDEEVDLSQYQGKVVLCVNVASRCGFTPQYVGLQALHEKYSEKGLVVLGFPCNQFGRQESGTNAEIAQFCSDKYKVTFDMFAKIDVKGEKQSPLYKYLTSKETNPDFGGDVKWNFEKFLIDRNGKIIGHYRSADKPQGKKMVTAIESALEAK